MDAFQGSPVPLEDRKDRMPDGTAGGPMFPTGKCPTPFRQRGFTMVELVVTMIIVGVLAVTILPRFDALGSFDATGYADQTKSILRYAQKSAVAQRRWVAVDVGANPPTICSQTYTAYPVCGAACSVVAPDTRADVTLPGGAVRAPQASTTLATTLSGTVVPGVLCFDALGRPFASGSSVPLVAPQTIHLTVSDAGTPFRTVTVEPETGYIR